jgi:hypothetical protein
MANQDCDLSADRRIWPVVDCNDFDFTLAFEQVGFVIVISCIFLLLSIFRVKIVLREDIKALSTFIHKFKIV